MPADRKSAKHSPPSASDRTGDRLMPDLAVRGKGTHSRPGRARRWPGSSRARAWCDERHKDLAQKAQHPIFVNERQFPCHSPPGSDEAATDYRHAPRSSIVQWRQSYGEPSCRKCSPISASLVPIIFAGSRHSRRMSSTATPMSSSCRTTMAHTPSSGAPSPAAISATTQAPPRSAARSIGSSSRPPPRRRSCPRSCA